MNGFLRGVASVLELWPSTRPVAIGVGFEGRSDADALAGDWRSVGRDLAVAMDVKMAVKMTADADRDRSTSRHLEA